MKRLFIITGKVHSGKTTMLEEWCKGRINIEGILSPVINNKRFLKNILTGETRLLEADHDTMETNKISIGKHYFNNESFEWGKEALKFSLNKNPEWLVIDEIGPLELSGKGFEPFFSTILTSIVKTHTHLMLVVRDSILNEFSDHYKLSIKEINIFRFK